MEYLKIYKPAHLLWLETGRYFATEKSLSWLVGSSLSCLTMPKKSVQNMMSTVCLLADNYNIYTIF